MSATSRALLPSVTCLLAALAPSGAIAQEGGHLHNVAAVRVTDRPELDGDLSDAVWRDAAVIDAFVQQEPNEGAPSTERTEVRVLYTGSSLFLAVHAFDSEPDRIIATEMRRDSNRILDEDNFEIIFDTFRDSKSAYMYVVSPLGAQLDQQVFDEGGRDRRGSGGALAVNRDWDGVWSVAARRTDDGWVAEIEIPMVNMRFPSADVQSWGMNFMRDIRRKNEQVFWAPIPREFSLTRVSLAGALTDLQSLERGMDLRIKPYITGGGRYRHDVTNGLDGTDADGDVGLDLKYGVTPSLNLDVTVNTDFAQAEVDNEQVNLTRFALFFPEKREFFLENANQFAVGTPNSLGRIADLFFSRRIGLTDTGARVPILGGARLTGKVGGNNIAVMDIQTREAFGSPGDNFFVGRYIRDLWGVSQIGALVINKQAESGGHYNRTFAADMNLVPIPQLTIDGFLAGTDTKGVGGGELGGHLRAGWLSRSWRIYSEYEDFGDSFNPEVGFVPRVGIRRSKIHFEHNPRPGKWGIRMLEPMTYIEYITDRTGRMVTRNWHFMVGTQFENGAYLVVRHNRHFDRIDEAFRVGGVTIDQGDYDFWDASVSFNSNPSRRFSYRLNVEPSTFYGGDRMDYSANVSMRATNQLALAAGFSRNDVDLPNGDFIADIGSFQVDYAFSPTISLRSLTQYNSLTEQLSTSARLRYIYRPGSDIYVVYDDVRRDIPIATAPFTNEFRDRQLVLKMTYLFTF
jgi:hypothetical protein